ncbi:hypothetical protein LOZ66_002985 [Ophidiomyces ophidiicola]|nr:hypothetical protein LOZ66_002985 [Ophidiomyces ophidiicola]
MVPAFPAITDVGYSANLHSKKPTQIGTAEPLSEWPELPGLEEVGIGGELPADWFEHPCPPELQDFPDTMPGELLRILRLSIKEAFNKNHEDEKELVASEPPKKPPSPSEATHRISKTAIRIDGEMQNARSSSNFSDRSCAPSRSGSTKSTVEKMSILASKDILGLKSSMVTRYTLQECASCFEGIIEKNLLRLECQHRYCYKCFVNLVTTSMHNESQFPPQCCLLDIPVKLILHNFDSANRDLFKQRMIEYSIPQQNRWYCPSASCGKWIDQKKLKSLAPTPKCPHCKTRFCGYCRGNLHNTASECPKDAGLEATLEEAEMHGWRRCYQCRAMAELLAGCQHMTCKCGAEFCYTCAAPWRTCQCTENDQRLREEQLQARRRMRNENIEREERELAEAFAEIDRLGVEESSRQEEEQKHFIDKRRRRNEDQFREREAQRILLVTENTRSLRQALTRINTSQQTILNMRHESSAKSILLKIQTEHKRLEERWQQLERALQSNIKIRIDALSRAQEVEIQELVSKHEDEEDETFISMSRHLKNKPNREERQKSIMDKLKAAQDRELRVMHSIHKEALDNLEFQTNLEFKALEAGLAKGFQEACPGIERRSEFAREVLIERHWFHLVTKKRTELLELQWKCLLQRRTSSTTASCSSSFSSSAGLRPKQLHFTKFTGPPSPPPSYPPPPTPISRPFLSPDPIRPFTPSTTDFPRPPTCPPPKPPVGTSVTTSHVQKKEPRSLKQLILTNSRNRRLNRSAFMAMNS